MCSSRINHSVCFFIHSLNRMLFRLLFVALLWLSWQPTVSALDLCIRKLQIGLHEFSLLPSMVLVVEVEDETVSFAARYLHVPFPCFLQIQNQQGTVLFREESGFVTLSTKEVRFSLRTMKADLPEGEVNIQVVPMEPLSTFFNFELEEPLALLPNSYDAKPANSTMGVFFVFHVSTNLTWVVKRHPPIPDFIAQVFDGNGSLLAETIVTDVPPSGVSFDSIVDMSNPPQMFNFSSLRFSVRFFEFQRDFEEHFNFSPQQTRQLAEGSMVVSVGDRGTRVKLEKCGTSGISLFIVHPIAIENLLVVVSEGATPIFVESERFVSHFPFGWVCAFPADVKGSSLRASVWYSASRQPSSFSAQEGAVWTEAQWIIDHGGIINEIAPFAKQRATLIATTKFVAQGKILFSVPYRLILQHELTFHIPAIRQALDSEAFVTLSEARDFLPIVRNLAALALFQIIDPHSPFDGTNWRLMFATFSPLSIPALWPEVVLEKLLGWSAIHEEVRLQRTLWEEEYSALMSGLQGEIGNSISQHDYEQARSHTLSKIFNISGSLVYFPLASTLPHEDDPSADFVFDDSLQRLVVVAKRDLEPGSVLTLDRGSRHHFKGEFFTHFGTVPQNAVDSASLMGIALTKEKNSRLPVLEAMLEEKKGIKDDQKALNAILTDFSKAIRRRLRSLPTKLVAPEGFLKETVYANRLLKSERAVLEAHLSFIEEDNAEL